MGRALKYEIPGPDWRVEASEVARTGWAEVFGRPGQELRLVVDLGFGRGEFLMDLAEVDRDACHLGVEYSRKRVLKLARRLARSDLVNVRLIEAPAEAVVEELLPEASVERFWINFPDPWPKARHHKRRLICADFVRELALRLRPGGEVHAATDHAEYAEVMHECFSGEERLANVFAPDPFRLDVPGRKPTSYELEWRAEGRTCHFFAYRRIDPARG